MKNKIIICNKFINLCQENIRELDLIKLMTENQLRESRNRNDFENSKIFIKLERECDAMIVEQREGVQFWTKRLNAIKKQENDKQLYS